MQYKAVYTYRKDKIIYISSTYIKGSEILDKHYLLFPEYQYDLIDKTGKNIGQYVKLKYLSEINNYTEKKWKSYDLDKSDKEIMHKIPIEKRDAELIKMLKEDLY